MILSGEFVIRYILEICGDDIVTEVLVIRGLSSSIDNDYDSSNIKPN